ncbi:MAG: alpha/beta hydrolase [Anaerolineales bacterium]|nr:alpha/beta hydrolase [Anaerolineales bacterium]
MSPQLSKPFPFKRIIWISISIVLAGLLIWGVSWSTYARPPLSEAQAALESDELVTVTEEPWLTFTPAGEIQAALIFYPGGRIDPRGYSNMMRAIAEEGYLVVVPSMPINMAIFDTNAAEEIISNYPDVDNWAIAGHSVGGTAAAMYTAKNPEKIDGLAIWASYPANSSDLSKLDLPVYLIYGELDEGVDRLAIEEKKGLLPPDTVYLEIPGGDHHQFGTYLTEPGDDRSTTPRTVQQAIIIQGTLDLLKTITK